MNVHVLISFGFLQKQSPEKNTVILFEMLVASINSHRASLDLTSGCVFWSWLLALVSSLGWVVSMLGGLRKRLSSCCWLSLRLWMMLHDCCCFCRKMLRLHKEERCPASLPHSYQVTFFFPL